MQIKIYFLIASSLTFFLSHSQNYIVGQSYLDTTSYVEYTAGNLPIILSAPHGGYLEPANIPDRDCNGCVYLRDSYTQEITRAVAEAIFEQTGCYPHMIINLLHRKKFDANREIIEAADGDSTVEISWQSYRDFVDSAKNKITESYGKGLFLDMHGHAHTIQRIEVGYLLTRANLQLADSSLNTNPYISTSSIFNLSNDNLQAFEFIELIRGSTSMGSMLENKGFEAVPSENDPFPTGNEPYFTGGYNTAEHGSRDGGSIDAIQLELNNALRFDSTDRERFADSLALIIADYIALHYIEDYKLNFCNPPTSIKEGQNNLIRIYPNPAQNYLTLESSEKLNSFAVYNFVGQKLLESEWNGNTIDISMLEMGAYLMELRTKNKLFHRNFQIKD